MIRARRGVGRAHPAAIPSSITSIVLRISGQRKPPRPNAPCSIKLSVGASRIERAHRRDRDQFAGRDRFLDPPEHQLPSLLRSHGQSFAHDVLGERVRPQVRADMHAGGVIAAREPPSPDLDCQHPCRTTYQPAEETREPDNPHR
jgi:hypothetical protein